MNSGIFPEFRLVERGTIPGPLWTLPLILGGSRKLSDMSALITTHLSTGLGPFADLWSSLTVQLPSVLCSMLWLVVTWAFQDVQLHPLNSGTLPGSTCHPLPWALALTLSLYSNVRHFWNSPGWFSLCLLLPILSFFVVSSGWKVNSMSIIPCWPEARI